MDGAHVCFADLPNNRENQLKKYSKAAKTTSPMTPSPRLERNLGFFQALTRRFGRRSQDDIIVYSCEDDSRSSSTDSWSSTAGNLDKHNHINNTIQNNVCASNKTSQSNFELSCNSSDTSSNADIDLNLDKRASSRNGATRRSTSSIRRALENFSISTRSLSCSGASSKENLPTKTQKIKEAKKPKPQQRILRRPIQYTYVKGISGLPTQRVPRSTCCNYAKR